MNIHWIQHVPFEGLGCIGSWLKENGHTVSCTRLWAGEPLPAANDADGLIVMGGPMGVHDEDHYPWLADEKQFIRQVLEQDRPVLGICLGAQLIADALGAPVTRNPQPEIGFFPLTGDGAFFPDTFTAFHWHGDTFGIPAGASRLASSAACENQAFLYNGRGLGLQFHLETTEEGLRSLYEHCAAEVINGPFIQPREQALANLSALKSCNRMMFDLLTRLF